MNIDLISGGQVDSDWLDWDSRSYHVYKLDSPAGTAGAKRVADLTNDIRRADKLALWSEFDVDTDNRRLSNERTGGFGPVGKLDDSTLSNFGDQILTDPLAAPLDTLNKAINQVFTAPGVIKAAVILAAVLVVVVVVRKKVSPL